jgi:tetratricopeptide (TPR) repeat protein
MPSSQPPAPPEAAADCPDRWLIVQICDFMDNGDAVYRFHAPSRALSRLPGVTVVDCDLHHRLLPPLAEAADVLILAGFDGDMFPLLEQRRAAGRVTVLEANDYYYDIHPWNPLATRWYDRSLQDLFRQGLTAADGVQTSTPELARRWRERTPRPVAVFLNQLTDLAPLAPVPARPLTVGWGGSPGHFADWYHITPVLERWLRDHPDVHLAVMNNEFARPFVRLPAERYRYTDFASLDEYLRFVRGLDIGLAPLLPTDYNRCRSDVKFLEYASQGVPGIYADLEPYRSSIVHGGTGLFYRTEDDFVRCLDVLAADAGLRRRVREEAYAYVARHRRLDAHIGERLDFYRRLLPGPPRGLALAAEVLAAAVRDDRYFQLRRQQPEQIMVSAQAAPATRASVESLTRLVDRHPSYLAALQTLGRQLNDLRDHRAALLVLERAHALNPHSAKTRAEIGRAYYRLKEDARARALLEATVTLNPHSLVAWQYPLRMLEVTRAPDGRRWAEAAHRCQPANYALALLGVKLHPPAEGVAVLQGLLDEYAPTLLPDERPLAAAAFSTTIRDVTAGLLNSPAALDLLGRAAAVFPQSALLASLYGQALRLAGRHEDSHRQLARALSVHRIALTHRAEFPQADGTVHYWQFGEHILGLSDSDP